MNVLNSMCGIRGMCKTPSSSSATPQLHP